MSTGIVDMGMSLDGFVAGPNGGPQNNLGDEGTRIHRWVYDLEAWRESQGLAASKSNRQIARELLVAQSTVKTHINNIYRKLDAHSCTQALAQARELNLV